VNNHFGLTCNPGFDLVSSVWSQRFRPGFTSYIWPYVYNTNCQAVSGQAKLILDNPLITYTGAWQTPDASSGDTLIWNFSNLTSQNWFPIGWVSVLTSVTAPLGDSICVTLIVEPSTGDINPANNIATSCRLISNSIDPNEKDVNPHGDVVSGSWLTYTVFFQNTGNDTAYRIFILDTIDAQLDMNTFQPIASSHSWYTYIENGNVVKFDFPDIMLPDSGTNEPLSHGWITYRIKSLSGLPDGTLLDNTAYIYFDFNSAVVTNTTSTAINSTVSVSEINSGTSELEIYPNPAGNKLAISNGQWAIEVYDVLGEKVNVSVVSRQSSVAQQLSTDNYLLTIDISKLTPGIYFVKVKGEKEERVAKFVKE
jgi:uncharacterized repeat protein (TIGR01451 family)